MYSRFMFSISSTGRHRLMWERRRRIRVVVSKEII